MPANPYLPLIEMFAGCALMIAAIILSKKEKSPQLVAILGITGVLLALPPATALA